MLPLSLCASWTVIFLYRNTSDNFKSPFNLVLLKKQVGMKTVRLTSNLAVDRGITVLSLVLFVLSAAFLSS